jgi:hypothetical protein
MLKEGVTTEMRMKIRLRFDQGQQRRTAANLSRKASAPATKSAGKKPLPVAHKMASGAENENILGDISCRVEKYEQVCVGRKRVFCNASMHRRTWSGRS